MSYSSDGQTTVMDGFAEALEVEDDAIADWLIDQVVDGEDDKEEGPKVKEVIKIEQIYVTKEEVDSGDFIFSILLVISIMIALVVISLLCVCIYRTFSTQREAKMHKRIKERMA